METTGIVRISLPLTDEIVRELKAGMVVSLWGEVYSARDAAHKRLVEMLDRGETPPFPLKGATIYYMGPSPAPPGKVIGAAGPTTSYRMDPYAPRLIEAGVKGMIGKGERGVNVVEAMKRFGAVYFAATGGAGALIAKAIKSAEVVAFPELGPEAIRRLIVEGFPAIVAQDAWGGNLYQQGVAQWSQVA